MDWKSHLSLFLFGFSSLMPLVNPIGTALIVNPYFVRCDPASRRASALYVCAACFALGLASLFGGSWALKFMGISIATTQMAGGVLIARMGLSLLSADGQEEEKTEGPRAALESALFYPIAFPLTLGPGGISALITLSAHAHDPELSLTFERMGVLALSLLAVLVLTYFCFVYSNTIINRIGKSGSQVLNRLMAFLVFCVGLQMLVGGLSHSFPRLFSL